MSDMFHRFYSDFLTVITESTGDVIIYFTLVLLFVLIIFISYYVYNRRKYYKISHQIPARLVREHLNTIIKNSNALRSSLFNEKDLADIADLEEVSTAPKPPAENTDAMIALEREKRELENELKVLRDSMSEDIDTDLTAIIKERDELLDAISDYKILEDDLANLKKLKEENKELKAKLGTPGEAEVEAAPAPAEEEALEAAEESEIEVTAQGESEAEVKAEAVSEEEKTSEDLLKEFEKMLGQ